MHKGDHRIVISKGNNLIIEGLGKTPGKTNEAFKYFCKHDPLYSYAAVIRHEVKDLPSNHINLSKKERKNKISTTFIFKNLYSLRTQF